MQIGTVFSQADSGTDAASMRRWAVEAEAAGFHHLMAYDHVLGATSERLGPGPFGAFPSAPYTIDHQFHDILVLFSHLAGVTSTIEFVTSVLVLPQRQTAVTAKQIATLDLLSNERLRLAVGVGWNRAEYESLGADFDHRLDVLTEQIELMRLLWSEREVNFEGRFHRLHGVGMNPLATRRIPVYLGTGAADKTLERVVRTADGWMPLLIAGFDRYTISEGIVRVRQKCEDLGRDPASLPIHGRVYIIDGWEHELERLVELGVDVCSVGFHRMAFPGRSHDEHLRTVIEAMPRIDAIVG